jgi:large subunit ribosomal protein L19e
MNLGKKKNLAVRALGVGKKRIAFVESRLDEIKEAITKQDIKDLKKEGAIKVKEVSGRKKIVRRKRKRGVGKIKKKVNTRKQDYVKMTRKLRAHIKPMKESGKLSRENFIDIRKKIRNKKFHSLRHLKEYIGGLK